MCNDNWYITSVERYSLCLATVKYFDLLIHALNFLEFLIKKLLDVGPLLFKALLKIHVGALL